MSKQRKFVAEILQAEGFANAAYILIPFDVEKEYGKKRVKIKATFDGAPYRGSLVRMGSPDHILVIRKDIRAKIGKSFGEMVDVCLEEDTEIRTVELPADFEAAMKCETAVLEFYKKLSYTHQKEYVNWIVEAKREDTRKRRIAKAVEMMKDGKKNRN